MREALEYASVGASWAVEQVGLPMVKRDRDGEVVCNEVRVRERLVEYWRRVRMTGRNVEVGGSTMVGAEIILC